MRYLLVTMMTWLVLAAPGAAGAAQTIEGQVLCCEDCWAEADRTKVEYGTAKDLASAEGCVAAGDPTMLAVRSGDRFDMYRLDQGRFRPGGRGWIGLIGARVRVSGAVDAAKKTVVVDGLEVVSTPAAAAKDATGTKVDLALKDMTGAAQTLSGLSGRIVVLNFWATFCAPCRAEMPELTAVQNQYAALGVQVIGAAADTADEKAAVLAFVKQAGVNFPVWLGASTADMQRFGLPGSLPGTVIVAADGKIAKVFPGVVRKAELQAQIDAMLAAAEAASQATTEESADDGDTTAESAQVSSVPS